MAAANIVAANAVITNAVEPVAAAAAPAAAAGPVENSGFGFIEALQQGGVIAWATLAILVIMSVGSWYIFFVKLIDQAKIVREGRRARTGFWQATSLREGAGRLDKNGAYRQIVDDSLTAWDQHDKLTDPVDRHDWVMGSLSRSQGAITSKLSNGLAFLATVGSTAPFVGLFGTVVGIYRALIKIGAAGQASIDAVAGPVGEALIMTALGLAVAVPAVMQYNWLMRRNKSIAEELARFSNDIHGSMVSGGLVKPVTTARGAAAPTGGASRTPGGTGGSGASGSAGGSAGGASQTPGGTGGSGASGSAAGATTGGAATGGKV